MSGSRNKPNQPVEKGKGDLGDFLYARQTNPRPLNPRLFVPLSLGEKARAEPPTSQGGIPWQMRRRLLLIGQVALAGRAKIVWHNLDRHDLGAEDAIMGCGRQDSKGSAEWLEWKFPIRSPSGMLSLEGASWQTALALQPVSRSVTQKE